VLGLSILICEFVSCGYVGPVLPPSANIPTAVSDLNVLERGDHLVVDFTTPGRTTDDLNIKKFGAIDLFATSPSGPERHYEMPLPPPSTTEGAEVNAVHQNIPVGDWAGKSVEFRVRTAVNSGGKYSAWSNPVKIDVIPPLATPRLQVEATASGYKLEWTPSSSELSHRILRSGPGMKVPLDVATAQGDNFIDTTSQWSTPYDYLVIAVEGAAESLPSPSVHVNAPDTFPPSVPADVTAIASPTSIEISWQPSPETDVRGYYLYRSSAGAPFVRVGALLPSPLFSDTTVEHGKTYRYQVSAIDTTGNESARSAPAEVDFP
jgi:fibronectin type 3 domain-containing protein